MSKKIQTIASIALGVVCCTQAHSVNFGKGKWNANDFYLVKSPRWSYTGTFVQFDDHIMNRTPELPDEEVFRKHAADVFSSLLYKQKLSGKSVTISSTMSFDHRMAPLIVIAHDIGKDSNGTPEYREHYEIVLWDKGINVWHHKYENGKPSHKRVAWLSAKYLPKKKYKLIVKMEMTRKGQTMTIICGKHTFGYSDESLPETFYAGITGCEGRNRFYDFQIKTQE